VPGIWERAYEDTYKIEISDYPFWLLSSRSMQFAWGANAGIPMIKEVADNIAGHGGVIINTGWAHEIGIADGGQIEIRSPIGVTTGRAVLRQGICPDTLLMIGQFGHWKTPYAKDFDVPSMNSLVPMLMATTDNSGSSADVAKVSVSKIDDKTVSPGLWARLFS
jgi:phenylacetyl-CoA:acceptor oxidoreductase